MFQPKRLACFLTMCSILSVCRSLTFAQEASFHTRTDWDVKPSLKYDALCLLNVLSGDPYYLHYYQAEYDHFHPLFTPEENAAFTQIRHAIKDEGHGIVSATLTLYFSTVDDETLPQMIQTAHDSSVIEAALKKTPYWTEDGWENYEKARPALELALKALLRVGFPDYWEHNAEPRIATRIRELSPDLPKYNIVPAIEHRLGFPLPSQKVTVYLLAYSEPHGIRLNGLRFITHISYPFGIVLHNAIHEPMHPPYHSDDPAIRHSLDLLGRDPLIADKVEHHNGSFGYNRADGLIEEDSVEALEQIISEEFGAGHPNLCRYWLNQDGGIHILATAIYVDYKKAWAKAPIVYSQWFVQAVNDGELTGTKLQNTVSTFFSAGQCKQPANHP